MSRDICGICWCPYDKDGRCGCENVKVINPAGALRLAEELESFPLAAADHAAAELRRQYEEIEKLKRDMHHYMLAANAEAELVDELTKENESILQRITEANKPVIERINAYLAQDEALLKQALYVIEAWERGCDKESYERDIDEAIAAIKERLNG
jgi:hypothetical protein